MTVLETSLCHWCGLPITLLSSGLMHTMLGDLHTCGVVPGENWPNTLWELREQQESWANDATGFRE